MFYRKMIFALLFLTVFQTAFAQITEPEKPKIVTPELRKEAVEFLRETGAEVGTLRSLENRISFSSEMAGLMWFYDEKEAGAMYQAVITDFKQLLAEYDSQMNVLGITPEKNDYRDELSSGGESDKARLTQKFYKAMGVRQQIAMSLAQHDPALAYNFYYDTLNLVSNAEFRKQIEQRDSYFEIQLMKMVALKDPSKAVEFGRKSLEKGVNWEHLELLKKIYEKDNDKGAEFADEIVRKFKNDNQSPDNFSTIASFMIFGAENLEKSKKGTGKKTAFSEQNMRDMADLIGQGILRKTETEEFDFYLYLDLIEKYAPSRTAQIRTKFAVKTKPKAIPTSGQTTVVTTEDPVIPPRLANSKVENETQTQENKAQKEQDEILAKVLNLGSKEIPKEEREKIVAQARKIIGGMGRKEEKMMALSLLASQVAKTGDKELVDEILKDAQSLVNPSPKNYKDFLETWFLVSAYSASDPEKAFPVLEDSILRLNDTLAAFIKVGEFLDATGDMIDDGEVQLGSFGGSMISGLTGELNIANGTLRNLAIADFGKTKALTNKFDRTEVRILAKMLILRAILGDNSEKKDAETEKEIVEM